MLQVVHQSFGSGCSFFIGSGQNRNPQKSKIRWELSSGEPLDLCTHYVHIFMPWLMYTLCTNFCSITCVGMMCLYLVLTCVRTDIPIFVLISSTVCMIIREKYVYLMNRGPIPINSNYYCFDHAFWKPTGVQTAR